MALVQPFEEVVICVDGVVPFAKMKQQRLRRFKAAATAAAAKSSSWDRNAITPGTYFMERLGTQLATLSGSGLRWIVQDASIPGEGEQKIMAYLRKKNTSPTSVVIYGLDADLIVLSLILSQQRPNFHIRLFRENIEFGEMIKTSTGEDTYVYMDIPILQAHIQDRIGSSSSILDYTMAMCFLGNDFLPHSLGLKMSDEGHETILEILKEEGKGKGTHTLLQDGQWNPEGVRYFFERFAATESSDIYRALRKKLAHSPRIEADTTPDFYPAPKVEQDFFGSSAITASLVPYWRRIYYENHVDRNSSALTSRPASIKYYIEGLNWIRAYYLGEPVSYAWYYPYSLPPLWADLRDTQLDNLNVTTMTATTDTVATNGSIPLPQEQLALVLPLESWSLIREKTLRQLPMKIPQYWPSNYTLFSCGKKWMWECEAAIPLINLQTLRRFVKI